MSLTERLNKRLEGGKFRLLNSKMYSGDALEKEDLELYHELYYSQINKWPVNPLELIIEKIRRKGSENVIADIGCGEAKIAELFKNTISLDLHPVNDKILSCDISHTIPLEDECVNIAVCCLSMMMMNITIPTKEINRILKTGGYWYIAEVRSRISRIDTFGKKFKMFGFEVEQVDVSNNQFVLFTLIKRSGVHARKLPRMELKPCLYKKR